MRFYRQQHKHYCGVDLHTRTMYVCILDQGDEILLHRNMRANPDEFLAAIEPYRDDLVVEVSSGGVEKEKGATLTFLVCSPTQAARWTPGLEGESRREGIRGRIRRPQLQNARFG